MYILDYMSLAKPAMTMEYAITLTLNPKLFKHECLTQHNLFMEQISKIAELAQWELSLVLELTNNFNCHYHGFIKIPMSKSKKSVAHRITDMLRTNSVIGFVYVKDIDNDEVWSEYTIKNIHTTHRETGIYPVCKDDLDRYEIVDTFML